MHIVLLKPCHTKNVADRRGACCALASNAVETLWKRCDDAVKTLWKRCGNAVMTLCNGLERHVAAFILKTTPCKSCIWRLQSILITK